MVALAGVHGVPVHVVGGGFNTLVPDEGIRGLVVHTGALHAVCFEVEGEVWAEAGASDYDPKASYLERPTVGKMFTGP